MDLWFVLYPTRQSTPSNTKCTNMAMGPYQHACQWSCLYAWLVIVSGLLLLSCRIQSYGEKGISIIHVVEEVANDTAQALSLISVELKAIRNVTLQNRIALVSQLASRGGSCAISGETCCSYIPGNSSDIENLVSRIRQKVKDLHGMTADWSLWSWAQSHLGGWGATIIQDIIAIVVVIVAIYLTVVCMKVCFTQGVKAISAQVSTHVQRPIRPPYITEGCIICFSCQEALELATHNENLLDLDEAILTLMETDPYWDIQYPAPKYAVTEVPHL